jgi:hypothetical protein
MDFGTLHACDGGPLAVRVQKRLVLRRTTVSVFAPDSAATVQQDSIGFSLPSEYEAPTACESPRSPPAGIVGRSWSDSSAGCSTTSEPGAGDDRLSTYLCPVMGLDRVPNDEAFFTRCEQLVSPAPLSGRRDPNADVIIPASYLLWGQEDAAAAGDEPAAEAAAAPRHLRLEPTYYGGYLVQRGLYEGRSNLRQAGRFVARFPVWAGATAQTPLLSPAAASPPPSFPPAAVIEPAVLLRPAVLAPAQLHERLYLDERKALRLGKYYETTFLLSSKPADASAGAGVSSGAGAMNGLVSSEHRYPTALHTLAAMLQPHNPVCAIEIGAFEDENLLLEACGQQAAREPGLGVDIDLKQHVQAVKSEYTPLARACSLQKGCLVESLMRLYLQRHSGQACDPDCAGVTGTGGFNAWHIVGYGAAAARKNAQTAFLSAVNEWEGEFHCAWLLLAMGYVPSKGEIGALRERLASHASKSSTTRHAALQDFCLQLRDFLSAKATALDGCGGPAAGSAELSQPAGKPTLEWRRSTVEPGVGGFGSAAAERAARLRQLTDTLSADGALTAIDDGAGEWSAAQRRRGGEHRGPLPVWGGSGRRGGHAGASTGATRAAPAGGAQAASGRARDGAAAERTSGLRGPGRGGARHRTLCRFFNTIHGCNRGDACHYAHEPGVASPLVGAARTCPVVAPSDSSNSSSSYSSRRAAGPTAPGGATIPSRPHWQSTHPRTAEVGPAASTAAFAFRH